MTIATLLSEWMEQEQKNRIKMQTHTRYMSLIKLHILPPLGELDIQAVTRGQIAAFLSEKRLHGNRRSGGELSSVSINLMLSILNMAFEYAIDNTLLTSNPCTRIKRQPATKCHRVDAFTREEQRKIECAIECSDDARLWGIMLCLYTGLRIGELLALEWSDLSEDGRVLQISKTVYRGQDATGKWALCIDTPKTPSSNRVIPLPSHIADRLRKLRRSASSPYIIANKKNGRMSIRSYAYIFRRLTERVGVRALNFHALRHTFATRALERGLDIKTLSELMGHGNASVTLNRYAHSMMETKIEMMEKMTRISSEKL